MVEDIIFTEIKEGHLEEVTAIYNYFVENTTVSFHTEPITSDEMRESVMSGSSKYPTYIISQGDSIVGFVLLGQHKKKQAYNSSVEVTIYLKPDCVGEGIGGKALAFIEQIARTNRFHALVASICAENERSKYLFEKKNGYSQCAHFKEIGFKFGRWLDIVTYQKILS
jgi:L-amino acid N-acyltransferase YncA